MKNTLKRTLSILLTLAMLSGFAVFSSAAVTESGKCGGNVEYKLYDNGEFIVSGTGAMEDYSGRFPAPFINKKSIKKIIIKDGVTSVGDCAFIGCISLTEVIISDSVTSIGNGAFLSCSSLDSVVIPASVTSIGNHAFGFKGDGENIFGKNNNFSVIGTADSAARTYAENNYLGFTDINAETQPGDADKDGSVTASDARLALRASVGLEDKTAELINIADMDNDGQLTAADARLILRKSVGLE